MSTAAGRQVDNAAERAVILVELEKEKAAHPAIKQVVDAEQHGRSRPVGNARARLLQLLRAFPIGSVPSG